MAGWVREEGRPRMAMESPQVSEEPTPYEPPTLDELGDVVELTNGSATDNIRDAKAWYF